MRKIKVLAISPYEGMAKLLSEVGTEFDRLDITSFTGNLYEGVDIVNREIHNKYDVIISRGGTANLIRDIVEIPVLEVSISAQDVLRAIKTAENYNGSFVIAGFSNTTEYAKMICDIMNYKIPIVTFENGDDVFEKIKDIKDNGFSLIVSDMIGSMTARKLGMNSILLSSGIESVRQVFVETIKLIDAFEYLNKQTDLFKSIIINTTENFIIYQNDKSEWFSNFISEEIKLDSVKIISEYINRFFEIDNCVINKVICDKLYTFSNKHYFYDNKKYVMITIKIEPYIMYGKEKLYDVYNKENILSFNDTYSSASYVGDIASKALEYSKTNLPIFILGENAVGKDKTASMIYENSPLQNNPFYIIDCKFINDKKFHTILNSDNSPLYTINTTIFWKDINFLSENQIVKLLKWQKESNFKNRLRFIFSMVEDINMSSSNKKIYDMVINGFGCMLIRIPPLRERIEDISNITTLYVNQISVQLGKQVVGFQEDAMEELKKYKWYYNLEELKRIIRELVASTKTPYITKEDTIKSLKYCTKQEDITKSIDLNKTLHEINYDVIQIVLKEENYNKEKTANRLGISRSTLWRMLKNNDIS